MKAAQIEFNVILSLYEGKKENRFGTIQLREQPKNCIAPTGVKYQIPSNGWMIKHITFSSDMNSDEL